MGPFAIGEIKGLIVCLQTCNFAIGALFSFYMQIYGDRFLFIGNTSIDARCTVHNTNILLFNDVISFQESGVLFYCHIISRIWYDGRKRQNIVQCICFEEPAKKLFFDSVAQCIFILSSCFMLIAPFQHFLPPLRALSARWSDPGSIP